MCKHRIWDFYNESFLNARDVGDYFIPQRQAQVFLFMLPYKEYCLIEKEMTYIS